MKGTEVPNPRRSSACDCTCVLTRTDHCLVNNSIMTFALDLIWHAFRYQFIRSIQNRKDKLQVQQLYTAGIPLLEAYLLPIANNRTRKERPEEVGHGWTLLIKMAEVTLIAFSYLNRLALLTFTEGGPVFKSRFKAGASHRKN